MRHTSNFDAGPSDTGVEIFVTENFVTPPTLGSLWTIWSFWALLCIVSRVQNTVGANVEGIL